MSIPESNILELIARLPQVAKSLYVTCLYKLYTLQEVRIINASDYSITDNFKKISLVFTSIDKDDPQVLQDKITNEIELYNVDTTKALQALQRDGHEYVIWHRIMGTDNDNMELIMYLTQEQSIILNGISDKIIYRRLE